MKFILKIIRNGLILSSLYFLSLWAATDIILWHDCKPILIFLIGYILTEYAHHINVKTPVRAKRPTLVF